MKRNPSDNRSGVLSLRVAITIVGCVVLPLLAYAAAPSWWSLRGVLTLNAPADDYALANQGQLKNIAKAAVAEFDAHMPAGAGDALHNLVNSWNQPNAPRNDFAPVNLGQLKNLAKPFYDRLITVRYADSYPWTSGPSSSDDFAIANLGQVKNLFGFDLLATDLVHDSDQNGLPDWWEKYYFGHIGVDPNALAGRGDGLTNLQAFQQGLSPVDYYSGQTPSVAIVTGNDQQSAPNVFLPLPFVVRVTDNSGNPLNNAPITFAVSDGGGLLAATPGGPAVATLRMRTGGDGTASVSYLQPASPGITGHVTATATAGITHAEVIFAATTIDGGTLPTLTVSPSSIDEIVDPGQIVTRNVSITNNSNATRQFGATLENSSRAHMSSTDSEHVGGPQFVWNDISAVGTHLDGISDEDEAVQAIDLSFAFPYFGDSYRKIYGSSNGFITVGNSGQQYVNSALPSPTMPANEIAAFHTDLDLGANGDVHYVDYGDRVVIQFTNAARYAGDGLATFQIVLKNDGTILFYYKEMTGTILDATVGVQDSTKQNGLTVAFQRAYVKNNLAVRVDVSVERFSSFLDDITWSDSDQNGGPDFVWDDISTTGTHLNNVSNADDGFEAFNMSFSFPYFNNNYSTVFVSSNGFVTLGAGSGDYNTYILPNAAAPANDIAAFQNDLNLGASGDVYYRDYGDHVVIQFTNAARYAGDGLATFQIVLNRDGTIFFYYESMTGKIDAATVGVQNASKDKGVTIANRQHYPKSNLAVWINTNVTWLQVAPTAGSLAPGESANVSVTLNPRYLTFGKLQGRINITTDDPVDPTVLVPVTMTLYEPPTVSVVSPPVNSIFLDSIPLVIRAAVNAVTGVNRVEFYDGNTLIGQSTVAPFTFAWTQVTAGSHVLSARVVDARNGIAISAAVPVQVLRDSDRNGLSDDWEMQFFGHLGEGADGDFDHDGVSNVDEYARGSDPTLTDGDNDLVPDAEDAFPADPNKTMLPPRYALIDLGAGEPVAVSDSGLVAGNDGSYADRAFFWKAGTRTRLGTTANLLYTEATDVNDQGQVVGTLADPNVQYVVGIQPYDTALGFIWSAVEAAAGRNPWTILAPEGHRSFHPNGSAALAINNAGVVAGAVSNESQIDTATKWTNGVSLSLGWGDRTAALAINSQGDIAGMFFGDQANGFADHGILNSVDLGVGFIRDLNDNRDILRNPGGLTLADGHRFPELDFSGSAGGQINNADEAVSYWNGAAFWKKHPKARRYDSFTVTDLVNPAALEELGLSEQNGLYLTAINNNRALAGFGYDDNGYSEAFLLLPVELMVDANRDGKMSFDEAAIRDQDRTSEEKPYRFWINNDMDADEQDFPPSPPDYVLNTLMNRRGLEDFTRLWVNLKGLTEMVKTGDVRLQLEWKPADGSDNWPRQEHPAIKIFKAVEPDGGRKYVEEDTWADQQLALPYRLALGEVGRDSGTLILPLSADTLNALSEDTPNIYLLFEGVTAGKGRLLLNLIKGGQKIGEYPPLYVDIRDIKNMYERWTVDPVANVPNTGANPLATAVISTRALPVGQSTGFAYDAQSPEEKNYIVFAHGWNLDPASKDLDAETAYKRLWWQDYKGRFAAFQWPTTYGFAESDQDTWWDLITNRENYDEGEFIAWRSAPALANLLGQLNGQCPNQVYLMGHSMGNVVAGEALRLLGRANQKINTYAACEGAVESECYDPSKSTTFPLNYGYLGGDWDSGTPNIYPNWLTPNASGVASKVSFYNVNDYALSPKVWELNQISKPDNTGVLKAWGWDGPARPGTGDDLFWRQNNPFASFTPLSLGSAEYVQDHYEIMAHAAEPRARALGRVSGPVAGFASTSNMQEMWGVDPHANEFKDREWHSGQFNFTNMQVRNFWDQLLQAYKLKSPQ